MRVELRRFKSYPRLSEETVAFNADLWIDGKKVAEASNDGHGGPNFLHFSDRAVEQSFYDYCASLPDEQSEYGPLKMNADFFVSILVEKEEKKAWFKRQSRNKVLFRKATDGQDAFSTVGFKAGQREAAIAHVQKKYPDAVIFTPEGEPLQSKALQVAKV